MELAGVVVGRNLEHVSLCNEMKMIADKTYELGAQAPASRTLGTVVYALPLIVAAVTVPVEVRVVGHVKRLRARSEDVTNFQ